MANPMFMVSTLLLAALLAGCTGDDGKSDASSVSTSTQTNLGDRSVSGSVSVGPGGGNASGGVNGTDGNASVDAWTYDNRSGSISGNGAVVNVPFEKEESFTVAENASRLILNLTSQGGELTLSLRAPDCDADDCAEEVKTSSGEATIDLNEPGEGDWIAVLQLEGAGPVEADYTLEIAQLGPRTSA